MEDCEASSPATIELVRDAHAIRWSSKATFSGSQGVWRELLSDAPDTGTYDVADPLGLFWSMTPDSATTVSPQDWDDAKFLLHVRTTRSEYKLELTRGFRAPGVKAQQLQSGLTLWSHDQPRGKPAVLVIPGTEGWAPDRHACLLASRGLNAAAVEVPEWRSRRNGTVPVEFVHGCIDVLRRATDADAVALVGFSLGGTLALLGSVGRPDIHSVTCFSGSLIVPRTRMIGGRSLFKRGGRDLPTYRVPVKSWLRLFGGGSAQQAAMLDEMVTSIDDSWIVPTSEISAPVSLFHGDADELVPIRFAAVGASGANVQLRAYPGAGHLTQLPGLPAQRVVSTLGRSHGGSPASTGHAISDSWRRTVGMLCSTY